jgi:hypothetical protein
MAVRGTIVWLLWMERNDAIFNNIKWSHTKLLQKIWLGLVDYGRLDWERAKLKDDGKFAAVWCRNKFFADWIHGKPRWKLTGPNNGFDVH